MRLWKTLIDFKHPKRYFLFTLAKERIKIPTSRWNIQLHPTYWLSTYQHLFLKLWNGASPPEVPRHSWMFSILKIVSVYYHTQVFSATCVFLSIIIHEIIHHAFLHTLYATIVKCMFDTQLVIPLSIFNQPNNPNKHQWFSHPPVLGRCPGRINTEGAQWTEGRLRDATQGQAIEGVLDGFGCVFGCLFVAGLNLILSFLLWKGLDSIIFNIMLYYIVWCFLVKVIMMSSWRHHDVSMCFQVNSWVPMCRNKHEMVGTPRETYLWDVPNIGSSWLPEA